MEIDESRMYRVPVVAQLLDVSPSTVYRAIESGALVALRIGSTVRVSGAALAAWLNVAVSTSPAAGAPKVVKS